MYRREQIPNYREPISPVWNIPFEAEPFILLYRRRPNPETLEQIRCDLTMTDAQYRWLLDQFPKERKTIGRILQKRNQTLEFIEREIRNGHGRSGRGHHRPVASKAFGSPYRNGSRDHGSPVPFPSSLTRPRESEPAGPVDQGVEVWGEGEDHRGDV